jgi:hypothetical protein
MRSPGRLDGGRGAARRSRWDVRLDISRARRRAGVGHLPLRPTPVPAREGTADLGRRSTGTSRPGLTARGDAQTRPPVVDRTPTAGRPHIFAVRYARVSWCAEYSRGWSRVCEWFRSPCSSSSGCWQVCRRLDKEPLLPDFSRATSRQLYGSSPSQRSRRSLPHRQVLDRLRRRFHRFRYPVCRRRVRFR